MVGINSLEKEFLAANLRFQISELNEALKNIEENEGNIDTNYLQQQLRKAAFNLRQIIKFCS